MMRTRSSRSISSPMAARTASIIRISGIEHIVQRFDRLRHGGVSSLLQRRLDDGDAAALNLVVAIVIEKLRLVELPAHPLDGILAGDGLEPVLVLEGAAGC